MQIDRIYYPVTTLGYGDRIGIWTIGCNHACENCSNPELWIPDAAKNVSIDKVVQYISHIPKADGITITGGDPFQQPEDLLSLVLGLKKLDYLDILVYTGYTIEELRAQGEIISNIIKNIGVLVDGRYIDSMNDNRSFRGSSNQRIIVLNEELGDRYRDADQWERKTQIVMNDNKVQAIGLPVVS